MTYYLLFQHKFISTYWPKIVTALDTPRKADIFMNLVKIYHSSNSYFLLFLFISETIYLSMLLVKISPAFYTKFKKKTAIFPNKLCMDRPVHCHWKLHPLTHWLILVQPMRGDGFESMQNTRKHKLASTSLTKNEILTYLFILSRSICYWLIEMNDQSGRCDTKWTELS